MRGGLFERGVKREYTVLYLALAMAMVMPMSMQ